MERGYNYLAARAAGVPVLQREENRLGEREEAAGWQVNMKLNCVWKVSVNKELSLPTQMSSLPMLSLYNELRLLGLFYTPQVLLHICNICEVCLKRLEDSAKLKSQTCYFICSRLITFMWLFDNDMIWYKRFISKALKVGRTVSYCFTSLHIHISIFTVFFQWFTGVLKMLFSIIGCHDVSELPTFFHWHKLFDSDVC